MFALRSSSTRTATWLLACALAAVPSFAFADHGHRRDRDDDRDGHRHRRHRDVQFVEVVRPAPRFVVGFQFGTPVCVQQPVYCPPPRPVVFIPPAPVCEPAPVACGVYYDPYCDTRFSNFELYLEHLSRRHGIIVSIRN